MGAASLPVVSLSSSIASLSQGIQNAKVGMLWIEGLPDVPYEKISSILDYLANSSKGREIGDRLNRAYTNNLVYKDAYAIGNGGPTVDRKRVLDLSPERLKIIKDADPDLFKIDDSATKLLQDVIDYWKKTQDATDKILYALANAIGNDDVLNDVAYNYRMVDYYERNMKTDIEPDAPRCGEHRDFGTFTIVHTTKPGLEYYNTNNEHDGGGVWTPLEKQPSNKHSLLLFGWCTQIRSNGRIPAALHRVVDAPPGTGDDDDDDDVQFLQEEVNNEEVVNNNDVVIPRRISAILFCAPKRHDTPLEPVVHKGEERRYVSGIQTGQLRGKMARKWRKREGTEDKIGLFEEELEIRYTGLKTQDDVVQQFVAV